MENIGLQDSLLSRFDLLFVMLDLIDSDQDHIISDHVVRMHRYRSPMEQDGEALPLNSDVDILSTKNPDAETVQENDNPVFEKYDPLLHGKSRAKTWVNRVFPPSQIAETKNSCLLRFFFIAIRFLASNSCESIFTLLDAWSQNSRKKRAKQSPMNTRGFDLRTWLNQTSLGFVLS